MTGNKKDMQKKDTFIIFSEISWDFLPQRHHFLADYFSKKYKKVYFVERVVSRVPNILELIRMISNKKRENLKNARIANVVYLRSFFLPNDNILFRLWNKIYWLFFWRQKQMNAIVYTFTDNPYVIGNSPNTKKLCKKVILDVIHNWWNFPWNQNIHKNNIERLIKLCDFVVTDSSATLSLIKKDKKLLIPPGVSESWFQGNKSLTTNVKPKIIFFGNLRLNSDLELIRAIASCSELSLSVYGRIDQTVSDDLLESCYKGSIENSALPSIIAEHDGIIIGYSESDFSSSISPAKFYESLATGKAIFSRNSLNHLPEWSKYVYEISIDDKLSKQIKLSLNKHELKKLDQINSAKKHLWKKRFATIEKIIDEQL